MSLSSEVGIIPQTYLPLKRRKPFSTMLQRLQTCSRENNRFNDRNQSNHIYSPIFPTRHFSAGL